jgi:hypothetical protein
LGQLIFRCQFPGAERGGSVCGVLSGYLRSAA